MVEKHLMKLLLYLNQDLSNCDAPIIPTSSSAVKMNLNGPCLMFLWFFKIVKAKNNIGINGINLFDIKWKKLFLSLLDCKFIHKF